MLPALEWITDRAGGESNITHLYTYISDHATNGVNDHYAYTKQKIFIVNYAQRTGHVNSRTAYSDITRQLPIFRYQVQDWLTQLCDAYYGSANSDISRWSYRDTSWNAPTTGWAYQPLMYVLLS